jgi:hypothetical protein
MLKVGDTFLGRLVVGITNSHLMLLSNVEKYPNTDTYKCICIKYKIETTLFELSYRDKLL